MTPLHKPKRIKRDAAQEKSTVEGNSFVFSDDIKKWIRGRNMTINKAYQKAPNLF